MGVLALPTIERRRVDVATVAPVRVESLSDNDGNAWDRFNSGAATHSSPGRSFFHSTPWLGAVAEVFGHRAIHLVARRGERIVGGLPLFEVRSLIGGTMLVSVPYGIYGGVVGDDEEANRALLNEAVAVAEGIGARCVELRSQKAVWEGVEVVDRYVTFRRSLPERSEGCLAALPRKARAAVRAARDKHKLALSVDDRHLPTVWRLYCRSMRRLGSLNYPYRFFVELVRRTPGRHFVSLVSHNDRPIGGLVTFLFNGEAMPYFVGVDHRYHRMNVYNFIYLTAMERAVAMGCHTFDFGRSRQDNVGACAFKKNQGFTPEPLEYQTFILDGRTAPNLTPSNPRFALARKVWPALPGFVTRPLGAWLSKHVPG